ncbi:MAG: bifunctional phosphopantothenoylcysteine decarboxylase/phosphopantothenate--cysteine ligase CoaBC [Candidatus Azobacteroides sp.]|nr:bifunctional phosphopantothenoylcysteine decarboxylase/phosphopantothenate--cysteine ligase CoaBC [Candidatus Azobacteroides sp.]
MSLAGKKIVLGVTGSIAAYKAAYLVRSLIKEGAEVQVLITAIGKQFITPVTLSALSGKPVLSKFFKDESGMWNSHVDLGLWGDAMLIAPASANTIAKMANGICDNYLLTAYLSCRCPVFVAPAMDFDMFLHPATQKNLETLKSYGNIIIEPASGELASGLQGKGRMEEPDKITSLLSHFFTKQQDLNKKKILITAGPTFEKIDPVRFIGNYSSGKMGYAIAEECAIRGAQVTLISGPVSIKTTHPDIKIISVESANEMYECALKYFPDNDIAILSAAVADYKPALMASHKIKRETDNLELLLESTVDIAANLGKLKRNNQLLVGFALETDKEIENADRKLNKKNLDFIVMNSLRNEGAGFQVDTNQITILNKTGEKKEFSLKSKKEVAKDIIDYLVNKYL